MVVDALDTGPNLYTGIIHNALCLVVGIDATQVAELQRDIADETRRDPAGALWDQAGL